MKKTVFFPGRVTVSFRKGPSGHLRQDPSEEAKIIKDNPSLQDKSAPQREDLVKTNARSVVLHRGGDVSDKQEVLGEYVLQFGKYKGKSFRWLLENDVGYALYLSSKVEEEERAGQFNPEGPCKDSLISFLEYSRSFKEIEDLKQYLFQRPDPVPVLSEHDNIVGFGTRAQDTWRKIWDTRADGYASFIMRQKCVPGSKMYLLQQYLLKQQQNQLAKNPPLLPSPSSSTARPLVPSSTASDHPVMEEDEELEKMMLSLSPTKYLTQPMTRVSALHELYASTLSKPDRPDEYSAIASPRPVRVPLPVPPELLELSTSKTTSPLRPVQETVFYQSLIPVTSAQSAASTPPSGPPAAAGQSFSGLSATSTGYPSTQLEEKPAVPPLPSYEQDVSRWHCSQQQRIWMKTEMEALGLWPGSKPVRHPMNMISLWRYPPQPELIDAVYELPSPKYFQLHPFFIWKPEHGIMERVRNNYTLPCLYGCPNPHVVSSGVGRPRVIIGTSSQYYILASRLSCKVCKKYWYERAHLAYLSTVKNVLDGDSGLYGQQTITGALRATNTPAPFGEYGDVVGWSF
ncbi:hypothetical protein ABG768_013751 [Culter alburnus]|uniref:DUF6729 domain-containing protein n=1 Tax=Culter alburnus TaxID=194366 RepID=A0AAW1Z6E9_CULAL